MMRFGEVRRLLGIRLWALCWLLLVTAVPVSAEKAATEASASRLQDHVKYLASDELEGRGVGTEGLNLAADYVAEQFEAAGLDVTRIDGSPFQKFEMVIGSELSSPNVLRFTDSEGNTLELEHERDFQTCSFGDAGKFSGELVFVGYGIDASDENYSDFSHIDVEGKTVIIMRRVPQQGNPHSPFAGPHGGFSRHAELRTKVSNAYQRGAAAVLFVNDPHSTREEAQEIKKQLAEAEQEVVEAAIEFDDADDDEKQTQAREKLTAAVAKLKHLKDLQQSHDGHNDQLMEFGYGGNREGSGLPIMHITQEVCNQLLEGSHTSLQQIETAIDADLRPRSFEIPGWQVEGEAGLEVVRTDVKNVIGVLEGEGPLADETIVIGAHYDHVGMGGQGSLAPGVEAVHNGADDNASGTATLIELARRLAAREGKPPRRIVFVAFTAEELGLIGSAHYIKQPLFPLESTIAMLNMDMVGRLRDDKLTVFGIGTSSRWEDLLTALGTEHGFELSLKPEGFGPSDHSSFYGEQIPVLHFFTGTHSDYHRPSDTWDKINAEGMARIANLIEAVAIATVETADRPDYLEIKSRATIARSGSRPYFGSIPDFGSDGEGYAVSGAAPDSPAAKGGVKKGDVIVKFGDAKIGGLNDFDLALRRYSAGDDVEIVVLRDGEEVTLTVTLDKPR